MLSITKQSADNETTLAIILVPMHVFNTNIDHCGSELAKLLLFG